MHESSDIRRTSRRAVYVYAGHEKSRRRPTLAWAGPTLPSAMEPLTSVFGMGTGMTTPLWPPAKNAASRKLKRTTTLLRGAGNALEVKFEKQAKPHAILVPIGSTDRSAYTLGLSRSWSTTWLQSIAAGKTCLGGGLALRCFQRLSVPNVATRPAAGATTEAPLVRDSRSSRTRESSPQLSCAHRG